MKICLTVFFEGPFWAGVFERTEGDRYEVVKVTFGAEPKDYEVYDFILNSCGSVKFSTPNNAAEEKLKENNPKRLQRKIRDEMKSTGIGTKAQIALKMEREAAKE